MKVLKTIILQFLLLVISLELFSIISIEYFDSLSIYKSNYPTYLDLLFKRKNDIQLHVADINKDFGVWHQNNNSFNHISSCFNVQYFFNSYGARDFNREKRSQSKRALFIGDSFTEGLGLDSSKRYTNLIEKKLGIPCMNFGVSGDFGTTQSSILYERLASKYDHDILYIELFPKNDFIDDDFNYAKTRFKNRYRPYFIPEKNKIIYYTSTIDESEWNPNNANFLGSSKINFSMKHVFKNKKNFFSTIERILRHTYFGQLILRILNSYNRKALSKKDDSFYYGYTEKNLKIFENSLVRILTKAKQNGVKQIILYTIPYIGDFKRMKKENNFPPLVNEIQKLCSKYNIIFIDLMGEFSKLNIDENDLYFSCDGHFSENGSKITADILVKKINLN